MRWATAIVIAFTVNNTAAQSSSESPAFERTEQREPCDNYDHLRQPMFGDLHVHTSYSFDSYISNQRNDPWAAYRYAKGEAIMLSNESAEQAITAQISRPLDFTAVTDHAEFLGEMNICTTDPWALGYWWPMCIMSRSENFYVALLAADWWQRIGVSGEQAIKERSRVCDLPGADCGHRLSEFWSNIQQAAEDHYDRSSDCQFTSFVGYEYTDAPSFKNLHRNVIFRNDRVTPLPISTYETGTRNFPKLWQLLREQCTDGDKGCDVMSIPHNPNLAGGWMFPDPENQQQIDDRLFFEPVVEMTQHKAASECRFDRVAGIGVDTEDELCTFEQNLTDNLASLGVVFGEMQTDVGAPVPVEDFARRNMLRNVLKDGMVLAEQNGGQNPFVMGFIGSTDTHSATPGGAEEDNYTGHLGRRDAGYRNVQDHFEDNPGGLAVVWAEENSRDAIFSGMRRKESYATSGTRPIVRFFGGWDYDANICQSPNLVQQGYDGGVPMGGDLTRAPEGGVPSFVVTAMKDPGTLDKPGTDLQRLQIIKGWVDAEGNSHEQVVDVAGNANNGAWVDENTCAPVGQGYADLCTVWQDPDFDASQRAFYYVRVLENPTCRWSTLQCKSAGVDPFADSCSDQAAAATERVKDDIGGMGDIYGRCCIDPVEQPFYEPVLQERAWTSPIWYTPNAAEL
ncbi:DUF3604 domain-containing protein [Sinobacterium norvegicum]|nr:DUF3604 domain-containing protein [Sinobacterium norvegicum]